MRELEKIIELIQMQYENVNKEWEQNMDYFPLNMKNIRVDDVYNNESLLFHIFNYRRFLAEKNNEILKGIQDDKFINTVSTRVKALNSIQYKIQNYEFHHEKGKIPLKKCLNDIFGIRMILNDEISYQMINKYINNKFPNLKCIESIKGDYNAIHIYFGNDNNKKFQWELQLWNRKYEKSNLESHFKYKQDYTKWEQENIKGDD